MSKRDAPDLTRRRLLVMDRYDGDAITNAAAASAPGDAWDLLLLGCSREWFQWQHSEKLERLPNARLVDPAEVAGEAHALVATFVVEYVANLPSMDLGGETLGQLLDDADGSEWWHLEISEKGPYRGPLIGQLYTLALLRLVTDRTAYAEIWCSLSQAAMADAVGRQTANTASRWIRVPGAPRQSRVLADYPSVRYAVNALASAARASVARVVSRWVSPPVEAVRRDGQLSFTVFPAWWSGAWGATPCDRFFSRRFEGYLAWITEPVKLWTQRRAAKRTFAELRILPVQQFLSFADAAGVLSPRRFNRFRRFERQLRQHLTAKFAGFQVGPLIGREVSRSWSGMEPFQDRLLTRAVRRAAMAMRPRRVLYRAEYQPSENALLRGLSASTASRLGFVHFPFGERYLSTRLTTNEIIGLADPGSRTARPLPDGFLAIGPRPAQHIAGGGYPAHRIAVCGPQRYGSLVAYRKRQLQAGVSRPRLGFPADVSIALVALAILEADNEALLATLVTAAARRPSFHFVVRTHPNRPKGGAALATWLSALGPSRASMMPAASNLYDYIAASDVLLCIGSMIAFEAIALGVMPIVFENPSTFAATSLREYDRGLFVVSGAAALCDALEDVCTGGEQSQRKRAAWPTLLEEVMGDLDRPLELQLEAAVATIEAAIAAHGGGAPPVSQGTQ